MTFSDYWKQNKDLYAQLGVTKAVAHKIWCDALDALQMKAMEAVLSKN